MVPNKKKSLPKHFGELIEAGDLAALKEVYNECEVDARGGLRKSTALGFYDVPDELVTWLVEQGADINAVDKNNRTPLRRMTWVISHRQLFRTVSAR